MQDGSHRANDVGEGEWQLGSGDEGEAHRRCELGQRVSRVVLSGLAVDEVSRCLPLSDWSERGVVGVATTSSRQGWNWRRVLGRRRSL